MELPYSDELNIGYLGRLFDNTSNCYKFFWFMAILRKNDGKNTRFTFNELVDEMIAYAWYMVTEYNLRLGPVGVTDNLEEVVKYIYKTYHIMSSEKRDKIIKFLKETKDRKITNFKRLLILNVPYRLQVPFYDEISIDKAQWYGDKSKLTSEINTQRRLMYYFLGFNGLDTVINLDDIWATYLLKHKEILKSWTQFKLILYLQTRNPSVPGIAEKIEPPIARDIERVRNFWKLIIQIDPTIRDIYGHVELKNEIISVDHFVPWQYVAHDELWNLHPTTKTINSSKNNSLPDWNTYFEPFVDIEYKAYQIKQQNEDIRKVFTNVAKYHLNNPDIYNQFCCDKHNRDSFKTMLRKVIKPVYDSAKMQGFREWEYVTV